MNHADGLLQSLKATRTVIEHGRIVQAGGTIARARVCAPASGNSVASAIRPIQTKMDCWLK